MKQAQNREQTPNSSKGGASTGRSSFPFPECFPSFLNSPPISSPLKEGEGDPKGKGGNGGKKLESMGRGKFPFP